MDTKPKKAVTVLVNDEIIQKAVTRYLEKRHFEVRRDVQTAGRSEFAIIGFYFLILGVIHQLRSVNPSLPIILVLGQNDIHDADKKLFYDVIELGDASGAEAEKRIGRWFTESPGKFLLQEGRVVKTRMKK